MYTQENVVAARKEIAAQLREVAEKFESEANLGYRESGLLSNADLFVLNEEDFMLPWCDKHGIEVGKVVSAVVREEGEAA